MAKVRAERKESFDKKEAQLVKDGKVRKERVKAHQAAKAEPGDSNFVELVPEASQRCPTGVSPPLVPSSTRPGRRQAVFGACAPMAEEWLREITAGGVQGNVAEIEIQQELAEVPPPPPRRP